MVAVVAMAAVVAAVAMAATAVVAMVATAAAATVGVAADTNASPWQVVGCVWGVRPTRRVGVGSV